MIVSQPLRLALGLFIFACLGITICGLSGCAPSTPEPSNSSSDVAPEPSEPPVDQALTVEDAAPQTPNGEPSETSDEPRVSDQAFREAAYQGDLHTVRTALEQGLDINTSDPDGRTALMMAAFDGREDVVETLLENSPQIDRRDAVDRTALIYAASGKNPGTVDKLLKAGASVNVVDNQEQWSALMFAAAEGNIEVVRLLLKYGADPTMADIDGETSLQFAANGRHGEVVALLEEALRQAQQ